MKLPQIPEYLKPYVEGLKLVLRFVVLFVASWFITETLKQIDVVPEFYSLKVWLFSYLIPVKLLVHTGLTLLGMAVDKALHEFGKLTGKTGWLGTKGLTGF